MAKKIGRHRHRTPPRRFSKSTSMPALRSLARSPWFSAIAIVLVSACIAIATLGGGLLSDVAWQPSPFRQPSELASIVATSDPRCSLCAEPVIKRVVDAWQRAALPTGARIAIYTARQTAVSHESGTDTVTAALVRPAFFEVLGVQLALGSLHGASDRSGVVLSYAYWMRNLHANAGIVGSELRVGATEQRVLGVLPRAARYPTDASLWLVSEVDPDSASDLAWTALIRTTPEQSAAVIGSLNTATADITVGSDQLRYTAVAFPLVEADARSTEQALSLIFAGIAVVLIMAQVSLYGLFLVRHLGQVRTYSIYQALGASTWQIIRPPLIEAVLIAVGGVTLGLVCAGELASDLERWAAVKLELKVLLTLDFRVAFLVALATLAIVLCTGVAPMISILRSGVRASMGGMQTAITDSAAHIRARRWVVGAQLALTTVVVAAAVSFFLAQHRAETMAMGYPLDAIRVSPIALVREDAASWRAITDAAERGAETMVSHTHAAVGVAWVGLGPSLEADPGETWFAVAGRTGPPITMMSKPRTLLAVSDGFLDAMHLLPTRGRPFTDADDAGAPGVIIINEEAARLWFNGRDALGQQIQLGGNSQGWGWRTVVGVMPNSMDISQYGIAFAARSGSKPLPLAVVPLRQMARAPKGKHDWTLFVGAVLSDKTRQSPNLTAALTSAARQIPTRHAPRAITPLRAVFMEQYMYAQLAIRSTIFTWLAGAALLLALVGTASAIADDVARRRHEFAIWRAIGASDFAIAQNIAAPLARLFGVSTTTVAVATAGLGIWSSVAPVGFVRQWQIDTLGQINLIALSTLTLAVVATLAVVSSLVPAVRALRIAPVSALRG